MDGVGLPEGEGPLRLLYRPEQIERYFRHGNGPEQIAHFSRSIDAANAFLREHPEESLLPGKKRPKGIASALQYFKDETFLTLYAFASLDLLGKDELGDEREHLYTELLRLALPGAQVSVTGPHLELEKQVRAPKRYRELLAARYREQTASCHPVWYLRLLGSRSQSHEGATHSDAVLTHGEGSMVMFEAKFLSDISGSTTYAVDRNQLTRNLEAGVEAVEGDLERFAYVFVTPRLLRANPESRFYGYKLREYMDPERGAKALERDLPHLEGLIDFERLSRRIGWVTWEEICGLLMRSRAFCPPAFPRAAFEEFFRERCLWPAD